MNEPDPFSSASRHGGRLLDMMAAFPAAPSPWLDLSTGINPQPWRGPRAPAQALNALPDPHALKALEAAAAKAFGIDDPARVAAVAGAETGLRLLPRLLGVETAAIVSPTYSGHEQAARAAGLRVDLIKAEQINASEADLLVVVNPNNPDGRAISAENLVQSATGRHGWTLIDESFVETSPAVSVTARAGDRLIVLRSFGKFYGLAGVRLGFVIADAAVTAKVRDAVGDWPVSADALHMGLAAYADQTWRSQTQARLGKQAKRLDQLLSRAGFDILGGTSLFRLASTPHARAWFDHLCTSGVLVRPFAQSSDWLRFGLPPRDGWVRLKTALEQMP